MYHSLVNYYGMIHRDTNTWTFFQCQDMRHALSPFSVMAHVSWRTCHGSRVMRLTHASGVTVSDIEPVQRQASHASCVMRHASGVPPQASGVPRLMRQASCVPRLMRQASGVRRQASGVRRPASGVRRQASGVRRQALGVRRQASHASCVRRQAPPSGAALRPQPSFSRRPIVVMTGNRAAFFHATALRFAPVEPYSMG